MHINYSRIVSGLHLRSNEQTISINDVVIVVLLILVLVLILRPEQQNRKPAIENRHSIF